MEGKAIIKVYFADEIQSKTLAIDGSTTVAELTSQVIDKIDIKTSATFALFACQEGWNRPLAPTEKVKAVVDRWKPPTEGRLVYRKKIFLELDREDRDLVAKTLTYHQVHQSIISGEYIVSPETAVLLAGYQAKQIYGEKNKKAAAGALSKALVTMIPGRLLPSMKVAEWEKLVLQMYEKVKLNNEEDFYDKYLTIASENAEYYGYTFYPPIKTGKKNIAFAVGPGGILLLNKTDKESEVIEHCPFSEITGYATNPNDFDLEIGRQNRRHYSLPTKYSAVCYDGIQTYIDVLVAKLVELEAKDLAN